MPRHIMKGKNIKSVATTYKNKRCQSSAGLVKRGFQQHRGLTLKTTMNKEAFNKLMGYPMETIEALAKQLQEINRNRIIELNQRDLKEHGIEKD